MSENNNSQKPAEKAAGLKSVQVKARPFGWRDNIGYMTGDLGNCFILGLVNSFLMIYLTNSVGLAGAIVGTMFLVGKFIDAFSDVTIGRLTDTSKLTQDGRFIPWIKKYRWFFGIATVLLFVPFVRTLPMVWRIVWIFVFYVAWGIFLSCVNIPYGSLASAISGDPDDRAQLSTFRSIGSAIGGAGTGFVIPMVVYVTISNGQKVVSGWRFFLTSIVCVILAWISYHFTVTMPTERVQVAKAEKVPLSKVLESLGKNKALLALIFTDLFIVINQILSGTTTTYLFNDYFHNSQAMSVALLFTYGSVILLSPFATWMIKHWGKKEVSIISLSFSVIMYLLMYFMHFTNPWLYLIFMFLATVGYSFFNLMVWAFITDVIDYHQYVTGYREDGTIYAVNSFARKCGQALAGGIGGYMLTWIGYQSSVSGGAAQSATVVSRIYALANLLPAALLLIAVLILAFGYPLSKKKIREVDKQLAEVNKQNEK